MQGHQNQIAPIQVQNPTDSDDEDEDTWGTCLCCGEDAQAHGMCLQCVNTNCDPSLDEACSRTGVVDPCELAVPDSAADLFGV